MLNIYDGLFKLVNPKLYNSPYNGSITRVYETLKNYSFSCQINFWKNLSTLKVGQVSNEDKLNNSNLAAQYDTRNNSILLVDEEDMESFSHELRHMIGNSRRKKIHYGKKRGFGFNALEEGIVEYFEMKDNENKVSETRYHVEIFVVEMLVFIFGEKCLEPFFKDEYFLYQFGARFNKWQVIVEPNSIAASLLKVLGNLENISANFEIQYLRLRYLLLSTIAPNLLEANEEFLKSLDLGERSEWAISIKMSGHLEELNEKFPDYLSFDFLDLEDCQYKNPSKEKIKHDYILEYRESQRKYFTIILENLIEVALKQGISLEELSRYMQEKAYYKADWFKELYGDLINETIKLGRKR